MLNKYNKDLRAGVIKLHSQKDKTSYFVENVVYPLITIGSCVGALIAVMVISN